MRKCHGNASLRPWEVLFLLLINYKCHNERKGAYKNISARLTSLSAASMWLWSNVMASKAVFSVCKLRFFSPVLKLTVCVLSALCTMWHVTLNSNRWTINSQLCKHTVLFCSWCRKKQQNKSISFRSLRSCLAAFHFYRDCGAVCMKCNKPDILF